jgi:hypothetical protein
LGQFLNVPQNVNPETLQTFGVLAIGLGFVLIGLGGISTYHASQKLQHAAELRQAEQKGELNAQLLSMLMKNQEQQIEELRRRAEQAPPAPVPATPPPAAYYSAPSPPPPMAYTPPPPPVNTPAPVAEAPVTAPQPVEAERMPAPAPAAMEARNGSDWEPPESLEPETPMRYLSVHQQHAIADTLRAHGRHVVTLESSYGDPVSREFAEELGTAFAEAHWVVRGIDEHRGLPLASGVTVSAASFPPRPETRAVYESLLSAGIAVTQQLDPKQHGSETVILVGAPL